MYYVLPPEQARKLLEAFERYIFGYSRLSVLIDDKSVSDIRVVAHNNIRVKRKGRRMEAGVAFSSPEEYRQFIDYIATRNQVNISNLNAIGKHIQRAVSLYQKGSKDISADEGAYRAGDAG